MERITSVSEWFEKNFLSINEYRISLGDAAISMMGECGNVSDRTMTAVTDALLCLRELIQMCGSIIENEKMNQKDGKVQQH